MLILVLKTDLTVKLLNCLVFPALMVEFHKLKEKKSGTARLLFLKNDSIFLLRPSDPLVSSLIQPYIISISPEQVYVLNLERRLSDTLPILARLLISFLLLANQLYTLREVTRSKSDNFFPMEATGEKIIKDRAHWVADRQTTLIHLIKLLRYRQH